MRLLLAALLALWAGTAHAEWHLLELDSFSLETAKIVNYDDSYFNYPDTGPAEHWVQYTAAKFNLDLVSMDDWGLYWDNTVDGASTDKQFRSTSWAWEAGVNLDNKIQLYWDHHSQHALDTARSQHFPLWNAVGVRAIFYTRE